MKKVLGIGLFFSGMVHFCYSQESSSAKLTVPADMDYTGEAQEITFTVAGVNWDGAVMKTHMYAIVDIPGVQYFNPVIAQGATGGYCELRFAAPSRADFESIMRKVFCELDIRHIQVNQATFAECGSIVIP